MSVTGDLSRTIRVDGLTGGRHRQSTLEPYHGPLKTELGGVAQLAFGAVALVHSEGAGVNS